MIGRILALSFASFFVIAATTTGVCGELETSSWVWLGGYVALVATAFCSVLILGEWAIEGIGWIARRANA